tara:strand:- start:628 stop:765 length:138 start_codon:yes stop_codon:yes gene_type:complete
MEKEKEKCSVDERKDVHCDEVSFKELPIDDEEWIRMQTTGGGAET